MCGGLNHEEHEGHEGEVRSFCAGGGFCGEMWRRVALCGARGEGFTAETQRARRGKRDEGVRGWGDEGVRRGDAELRGCGAADTTRPREASASPGRALSPPRCPSDFDRLALARDAPLKSRTTAPSRTAGAGPWNATKRLERRMCPDGRPAAAPMGSHGPLSAADSTGRCNTLTTA